VIGGFAGGSNTTAKVSSRVYALRDGEWVELPELNHPRAAAAAAVLGGELIVVGGQADGELVPETEVFDGKRWRDVAPLPTPREHLAAASDGRYVYALGGRELSSEANLGTLERYDPVKDRWTELPEMPKAIGSFDAAITLGHLVAVGGEEPFGVTGEVQSFDLQTESWSSLPPLNVPRHGLTVVADDNLLYALVGAQEVAHAESTATAEVIDLAAAYATPPPVGEWRRLASAPGARQQAAGAVLDGRLWTLGGLTGDAQTEATASTAYYDPAINSWSAGPDLPLPLHHASAVNYDGEIVVVGGWVAEGSNLTAQTSGAVYALRDGEWVELPPLNHPRAAAGAAVVGHKLVVTGGQDDGELVTATEVFDGEGWTDVAPLPTPREHLSVASDGTYVYAAGGRDLSADLNLPVLERYDPAADTWATMPEMPVPAGGFAAAVVDGNLIVAGGEEALTVIEAVQSFDLADNAWSALPPMIESRHGHTLYGLGQTLYALGGALTPGHTGTTASAEALDFEASPEGP
jgi:non-specific serine/threonine protein kinase